MNQDKLKRILTGIFRIVLTYLICWHIAFTVIFVSRGDGINFDVYFEYIRYLFYSGLMIPTFIQFIAILMTILLIAARFVIQWIRRKK